MPRVNRYLNPLLALALALVLGATTASADGSSAYFELGSHGHWLNGPGAENWSSAVIAIGGRAYPDADDDVDSWGAGAKARAGVGLPEGILPAGAMVELGGSWFRNEEGARDDARFGGFPPFGGPGGGPNLYLPLLVDGAFFDPFFLLGGMIVPESVAVHSEFDSRVDHWDLRLQVAVPVSLGESLSAKGRLGLVGGVLDQNTALTQDVDQDFLGCCVFAFDWFLQNDIDVDIDSWFIGPVIGAGVAVDLVENIRFTLDAEVALLYHRADLRIDQTVAVNGPNPMLTGRVDTHETDEEDHFNARSRIEGALEVDLGLLLLRLTGAFNYWTYAPTVVNPRLQPGFPTMGSFASSRLSGADMMSAEAGASIVIPF